MRRNLQIHVQQTTSYSFDMSGRMLTRVYVGHPASPLAGQTDTDTFTYDRNGRMLSGIKGRYNNTVTFSYDDRGQQIQETLTTHGQTYTVGYQKNELGQTTQLQYPDGSLVDRAYTDRGQLLSVKYTPNGGTQDDVAVFVYDAGGRETTRNVGNGLTTSRSYYADNQIQSIATPSVETLTYTYDPNKNPTSETRSGVMAPYSWSTGPTGFDDEDRLTNWQRSNGDSQTWNLSPVHDWTSTTINGAVQTRTHGPAHEILTMAGAEVDPTPAVLQHDTKGNMTTDNRGCGMAWDFDNMLQSFAGNGVTGLKDATYEYDAIGRRVAKNVAESGGTQTTLFVQAGQQVVCEYAPTNPTTDCDRKFIYGTYIDETLLFDDRTSVTAYYFHHNRQYTTYAVTDNSGLQREQYCYDSRGKHATVSATGAQLGAETIGGHGVTFTGRLFDQESATHYFRNRMYSATSGTFLGRDTAGFIDGANLYSAYFAASYLDPSGMKALTGVSGWPTTIPPNHEGCHCEMDAESMLPSPITVFPTFPGGNASCLVTFVTKKCAGLQAGGSGITPGAPSVNAAGIPEIQITICDKGIQSCDEYTDTIEHELVHARDLCNPFQYPPAPKIDHPFGWEEYDKCTLRTGALITV